ncbi:hypothetical protein, partial [Paraburkholderia sp. SIMBA_027]|uniref:hypothetical protein n=1 Tax=Paraburkholderia sp. SIMBA_027 TaxID=3085770 RepID=UPI00397DDEE2
MIEVAKICKRMGYKMLATIHDEILIEVPINISRDAVEEIEKAMLGVVKLKTPFKVDTAFMEKRWGEEVGKDEWFN